MAKQQKAVVTVTKVQTHFMSHQYKGQWHVTGSAANPYTVSEAKDGNWACSCMAWTRTHPREDCKHIMRVKLSINTPAPAATMSSVPSLACVSVQGRKFRD